MKRLTSTSLTIFTLAILLTGCASLNEAQKGAIIGAGAGTVVGGAIGKATGGTGKGAIIGAAVGGAAGAIIGAQMDKQAEELEEELDGADVERVDEGIQVTFDSGILFALNSSDVAGAAQANLDALATSLQTYPNTDVVIIGHTDATGSDTYNQQLSERRADSAAAYLLRQGIPASRITTLGKGESEPIADNDSELGRQQNRRVEVAIFANEEFRSEAAAGNN